MNTYNLEIFRSRSVDSKDLCERRRGGVKRKVIKRAAK